MKTIKLGDHVKAAITSKHHGYRGTVVNPNGAFLIIKCDEDSPNPLAYSSTTLGEGKFFCLDRDKASIVKEKPNEKRKHC